MSHSPETGQPSWWKDNWWKPPDEPLYVRRPIFSDKYPHLSNSSWWYTRHSDPQWVALWMVVDDETEGPVDVGELIERLKKWKGVREVVRFKDFKNGKVSTRKPNEPDPQLMVRAESGLMAYEFKRDIWRHEQVHPRMEFRAPLDPRRLVSACAPKFRSDPRRWANVVSWLEEAGDVEWWCLRPVLWRTDDVALMVLYKTPEDASRAIFAVDGRTDRGVQVRVRHRVKAAHAVEWADMSGLPHKSRSEVLNNGKPHETLPNHVADWQTCTVLLEDFHTDLPERERKAAVRDLLAPFGKARFTTAAPRHRANGKPGDMEVTVRDSYVARHAVFRLREQGVAASIAHPDPDDARSLLLVENVVNRAHWEDIEDAMSRYGKLQWTTMAYNVVGPQRRRGHACFVHPWCAYVARNALNGDSVGDVPLEITDWEMSGLCPPRYSTPDLDCKVEVFCKADKVAPMLWTIRNSGLVKSFDVHEQPGMCRTEVTFDCVTDAWHAVRTLNEIDRDVKEGRLLVRFADRLTHDSGGLLTVSPVRLGSSEWNAVDEALSTGSEPLKPAWTRQVVRNGVTEDKVLCYFRTAQDARLARRAVARARINTDDGSPVRASGAHSKYLVPFLYQDAAPKPVRVYSSNPTSPIPTKPKSADSYVESMEQLQQLTARSSDWTQHVLKLDFDQNGGLIWLKDTESAIAAIAELSREHYFAAIDRPGGTRPDALVHVSIPCASLVDAGLDELAQDSQATWSYVHRDSSSPFIVAEFETPLHAQQAIAHVNASGLDVLACLSPPIPLHQC